MPHATTESTQQFIAATTRQFLLARVGEQIVRAERIHKDYATLWRSIERMLGAGGKYIRPYLAAISYRATDPSAELDRVLPALGAVELLNLSLLIHDDIIDRDDVRYGIRNIAGQRADEYVQLIEDERERKHFANSAALLAGDLTLSLAHQLLAESEVDPGTLRAATDVFNEGIFRVAGGELLDTESAFRGVESAGPSMIAREKTASYSTCMPLKLGAALAGAKTNQLQQLDAIGLLIGEAYQLQDDLLGTFGDAAVTGKSTDGDLREGKRTYMIEWFYAHATDDQKTQLERAFQVSSASESDFEHARVALRESGTFAATEQRIDALTDQALQEIEQLGWPRVSIDELEALARKNARRQK